MNNVLSYLIKAKSYLNNNMTHSCHSFFITVERHPSFQTTMQTHLIQQACTEKDQNPSETSPGKQKFEEARHFRNGEIFEIY